MDIVEVSRCSGLPASTLRYYEEKGLISSIGRQGLRRVFDNDILERLSLIALGQSAGFALDEIAAMFTLNGLVIDRALLSAKAEELDKTIRRLEAMRDGLLHAAKCPAPNHLECPTFQRLLQVASEKAARKARKKGRLNRVAISLQAE